MNYLLLMQIIDAQARLEEVYKGLVFLELASFHNIMKERAVFCVFQHEVDIVLVLEAVVEFANMRVIQLLLDLNFSLEHLLGLILENRFLSDYFHRVKLIIVLLLDQTDVAIRTFPEFDVLFLGEYVNIVTEPFLRPASHFRCTIRHLTL